MYYKNKYHTKNFRTIKLKQSFNACAMVEYNKGIHFQVEAKCSFEPDEYSELDESLPNLA